MEKNLCLKQSLFEFIDASFKANSSIIKPIFNYELSIWNMYIMCHED